MKPKEILEILDQCCDAFTFPMLDNGYVYLGATRLSLYRSDNDWAIVIEVFGFSPRTELPDTHIYTFSSRLQNRKSPTEYINRAAYDAYIADNQYNESRFIYTISEGDWQDSDNTEFLAKDAQYASIRGKEITLPPIKEYSQYRIQLENSLRVKTFEFCRFLAATVKNEVLATPEERRINIQNELTQILQLEEWNHPNVVDPDARPSRSETFQQLAQVLMTGDPGFYQPAQPPNTHWGNWPDGGTL